MREIVLLTVIPVIVLVLILWICKALNFSFIPPNLRAPPLNKKEQKKLKKLYKWDRNS